MLESHIHGAQELYEGERHRLRAHAQWLVQSPPKPGSLRKRLEALGPDERLAAAHAVITLAAADGEIDPAEVKTLQKIFSLLDLDPESVYSDLHAITAGDEPVVIREGRSEETGQPIPPRPDAEERRGLDRSAIDEKIEETAAVSSLLAGIFVESEDEAEPPAAEQAAAGANGLDRASATFLEELGKQESWTGQDVEQLAAQLDLMVDGDMRIDQPRAPVPVNGGGAARATGLAGQTVCFTGALTCHHDGELMTRQKATDLATDAGLTVLPRVTKKLDLLVMADPDSMSGKAKQAREYGVRLIAETAFWEMIGIEVR
jgi:TerB-C domain/Tellurite resistance protein TerB/BRCA1 C Terminus (BRCT) domain